MKELAVLFAGFLSTSAMAASPEALKAVLDSSEISNVSDIQKVEVSAAYHCQKCFDVVVSGTNMFGVAYVKVRTEQGKDGVMTVKYIEGSK